MPHPRPSGMRPVARPPTRDCRSVSTVARSAGLRGVFLLDRGPDLLDPEEDTDVGDDCTSSRTRWRGRRAAHQVDDLVAEAEGDAPDESLIGRLEPGHAVRLHAVVERAGRGEGGL